MRKTDRQTDRHINDAENATNATTVANAVIDYSDVKCAFHVKGEMPLQRVKIVMRFSAFILLLAYHYHNFIARFEFQYFKIFLLLKVFYTK